MTDKIAYEELHPRVVLAVAAHADDIDFCMAGTVAKWAAAGAQVYYLILTNGDRGTADVTLKAKKLAQTRQAEQRAAAELLGVKAVFFGAYRDCRLKCDAKVTRDIVRAIRRVRPDTVLAMDPSVLYSARWGSINHPDHRAAGQATLDAVYPLARDHLSFPELIKREHLPPHKVATLLLANSEQPNYWEDITDFIEDKQRAMAAHTSQISDAARVRQVIQAQAAAFGEQGGGRYTEAYVRIDIRA